MKSFKYPNTEPDAPKVDVPYSFADMTENGALGDARLATKEDGERIAKAALDRASAFLA